MLRHTGAWRAAAGDRYAGDPGQHPEPYHRKPQERQADFRVHRRDLYPVHARVFGAVSFQIVETRAKVRGLLHRLNAECGRPAAVPYGKDDAFQLGVHHHAQSGGHRQGRACEASEYLGSAAFVHQERQRRVRAHQGRKFAGAF